MERWVIERASCTPTKYIFGANNEEEAKAKRDQYCLSRYTEPVRDNFKEKQ